MPRHKKLLIVLMILSLMLGGCARTSASLADRTDNNIEINKTTEDTTDKGEQSVTEELDDESTSNTSETIKTSGDISGAESSFTEEVTSDTNKAQKGESSNNTTVGKDSDEATINDSSKVSKEEKTGSTGEVSEEDIKFADKVKAFKLAAKRLSADQITELMDMSKGGFTAEEKVRAKELFYKNFTDEEREWILKMYDKYN